jgi:hypothetical protein
MRGAPSPRNRRAQIDAATLAGLYVERKWTVDRVAARLGVSPTTVRRRMRELGVQARPRGPMTRAPSDIAWSPELAWVVGLIATDGNLARNGRSICITSKDRELLETVQRCLGGVGGIGPSSGGWGRDCLRFQWTSRPFHAWLTSIGLMPAKTLRLGALAIPDRFFPDFLRGCIDGDGSIVTYVDRYNTRKHPKYVYDRLFVSLVSASPAFLQWVRHTVLRLRGLSGHLRAGREPGRRTMWRLRYAKRESAALLRWIYYTPDVPALRRKRDKAFETLATVRWYRRDLSGTI